MERMDRYSSWTPYAIYNSWLVTDDSAFLADLLPDMKREYSRWEKTHRLPNGLYWQSDVQDAMEESISGGRKKQYARPTISSYMYGNAMAIFQACRHAEDADSFLYKNKADTLKYLVEKHLWNESDAFFETRKGDTLANVREAIGYTPWYFNLPTQGKFDSAWLQISDPKGFSAPFGLDDGRTSSSTVPSRFQSQLRMERSDLAFCNITNPHGSCQLLKCKRK